MLPGTVLRGLFKSIGIIPMPGCHCFETMKQMDEWGVEGCKRHLMWIVTRLEEDSAKYHWHQMVSAAYLAAVQHYIFINPFNQIQSFVEEAIRLCEMPPAGLDSLIGSIGSRR